MDPGLRSLCGALDQFERRGIQILLVIWVFRWRRNADIPLGAVYFRLPDFRLSLKPMAGADIAFGVAGYVLNSLLNKVVEKVKMVISLKPMAGADIAFGFAGYVLSSLLKKVAENENGHFFS